MKPIFSFHAHSKRPALFSQKTERRFVRGTPKEHRTHTSSGRWHIQGGMVWVLWGLFLGTLMYQGFFSGVLAIKKIVIEGAGLLSVEEIEGPLREAMSGKYLRVIPRENFLLASPVTIQKSIVSISPLIQHVEVQKEFPDTLRVSLLERGDLLWWCSQGEMCQPINEQGKIEGYEGKLGADRVPQLFLVDESGKAVQMGDQVVSPRLLQFIRGLPQALAEQAGITLRERIFLPSRFADEVRVESDQGLILLINTDLPLEKTLNTLRIVREKAVPKERVSELLSVDLRISNKAFYQLQDGNAEETSVESEGEK